MEPHRCGNMAEVRRAIDRLDEQIMALVGQRFRYMDAAARIKQERVLVRDEARKAEVLRKVAAAAARENVPPSVALDLYERLIEASIAYEFDRFDALRADS
jgi:isochorismate pyruvate lyase